MSRETRLDDICDFALSLNPGDNLATEVLRYIIEHARESPIRYSAETGCGGSTLLLSQLSEAHLVFAIEGDTRIITRVKESRLFRGDTTQFIEGPTQVTLPKYHFSHSLDLVLIDGPHAFPYPHLEYYYLYPQLRPGALLILDDIHIRSVHDLFEFIRADRMFQYVCRIGRTAFFKRTDAPVFDRFGDGWWDQPYNKQPAFRVDWRDYVSYFLPRRVRNAIRNVREVSRSATYGRFLSIDSPQPGAHVDRQEQVYGSARLPAGSVVWLFARRADMHGWWPQAGVRIGPDRKWTSPCHFGEDVDAGHAFEIAVVSVDSDTDRQLRSWMDECAYTNNYPPIQLPRTGRIRQLRTVRRKPPAT